MFKLGKGTWISFQKDNWACAFKDQFFASFLSSSPNASGKSMGLFHFRMEYCIWTVLKEGRDHLLCFSYGYYFISKSWPFKRFKELAFAQGCLQQDLWQESCFLLALAKDLLWIIWKTERPTKVIRSTYLYD